MVQEGPGALAFAMHSQLLEGLKSESKHKIAKGGGVGAHSLTHNTLRGRRGMLELWDGIKKS